MVDEDNIQLRALVTALCDRESRCTICYRQNEGAGCEHCGEAYYLDCTCVPLTPEEIVDDFNW